VFSGDAPTMGKGVFSSTANDFRVLYHPLAAGFASPAWLDSSGDTYPAVNLATLPTPKPVLAPPSPLIGKKISITLKDGTVAAGKIVKVDPDGISIITDDGGGKILYDSMTDADKATYGYHQQANDSSPTEATTPTPTSSVSIGSSPPTEGGWHQVAQFSGSNNKKTEPFTISTERWRIKWTSSLPTALDPKFANMLVCGANCFVDDGSLNNTSVCNQIGPGSDVTESMEPERTTSPFTRHPYGR
jgi:hypothetical protein